MLKKSQQERRLIWMSRKQYLRLQEKKSLVPVEDGTATRRGYKEVFRICREKTRKVKAQLEIRLAIVVKQNKKLFCKYINRKRKAMENLQPLLGVMGKVATENKEKTEVLNTFFTSVFKYQINYLWITLPPDVEVGDGDVINPPQMETIRDPLFHLDCHKSIGTEGSTRECGGSCPGTICLSS